MSELKNNLKIGDYHPKFQLKNSNDILVSSEDFKGSPFILYFYPKDNTPGCTKQACNFRDSFSEFENLGVSIIGISKDTISSHKKFIEKYNLPFILLSDDEGKVCKKYDVLKEKSIFGKSYIGIERTTFIINKDGIIQNIYKNINISNHVKEVLHCLREIS